VVQEANVTKELQKNGIIGAYYTI